MALQDLKTELRSIISTLAGEREASRDIKSLRLMQLKQWLIDEEKDDLAILRQAASAYASMRVASIISEEMRERKVNQEGWTPSSAVRSLVEDEHKAFMQMLDQGFILDRGFSPFKSFQMEDPVWNARIDSVCHYVGLCISLHFHKSKSHKGLAYLLYDLHASNKTFPLRKDIKPLTSARRSRLAFVFVARRLNPWLLEYLNSPTALIALLATQTKDVERLRTYFAQCAYAQAALARGSDVTCALIEEWSGTDAQGPKSFKVIPMSEIEAAEKRLVDKTAAAT